MKLKKLVALGLSTGLAVSSLAACGQKSEPAATKGESVSTEAAKAETSGKEEAKAEAGGKFTYWVEMNGNAATVVKDYGEIEYFKQLQDITGVQIEFMHPPAGQAKEQFKLLIASRKDLPDVIAADWLTMYPGGPEKAVKDGIIIDLNDYIDQLPNYKAFLESNPDYAKQAVTDEGTLFGFHGINVDTEHPSDAGLIVRQDWLDDLGLKVPETIDEWENVLRKFKEEKGATAPFTVLLSNFLIHNGFNSAYGVGNDFYLDDDGNIQYGPIQPAYKDYLTILNKWYKEGLIDPDFASIDNKTISSNMINGKSGVTWAYIGSGMGTWTNAATEEGYKLAGCANPVLNKGDEGTFTGRYKHKVMITAAVTTNAKNLDGILKQFDYLYTEEGKMLKNFGIEGVHYNMVDGKPVYTDLILKNPDGLSVSEAMAKYIQCSYPAAGMVNLPEYQEQYYALPEQKEASVNFNTFAENAKKHVLPPITANSDESKELANIMSQIEIYRDESIVAFITGATSLDEFDNFVKEINNMGIEKAIEIKKAGLARYNAR